MSLLSSSKEDPIRMLISWDKHIMGYSCHKPLQDMETSKTEPYSIQLFPNKFQGIVSTCLLYCSRYEDTEVYQNPADPRHRILVINLRHFPYIEFPFGEIPTGTSSEKRIPCKRLAIVYVKISQSASRHTASNKSKGTNYCQNPWSCAVLAWKSTPLSQYELIL